MKNDSYIWYVFLRYNDGSVKELICPRQNGIERYITDEEWRNAFPDGEHNIFIPQIGERAAAEVGLRDRLLRAADKYNWWGSLGGDKTNHYAWGCYRGLVYEANDSESTAMCIVIPIAKENYDAFSNDLKEKFPSYHGVFAD